MRYYWGWREFAAIAGGIVLGLVLSMAFDACSAPSAEPTPLQRRKDIEDQIAEKRLAQAYICGVIYGRGWPVDDMCREFFVNARKNGFKP